MFVTTLYMLFGPNIMPLNIRMRGQQRVGKSGKAKKLLLIKVLLIGVTIKVLLTGVTMSDYRKNGKFRSKPYENEILIKPDR